MSILPYQIPASERRHMIARWEFAPVCEVVLELVIAQSFPTTDGNSHCSNDATTLSDVSHADHAQFHCLFS